MIYEILSKQPEVNPNKMVMMRISRNAGLALLVVQQNAETQLFRFPTNIEDR